MVFLGLLVAAWRIPVWGDGSFVAEPRPGGKIKALRVEGFGWRALVGDCRLLVIRIRNGPASKVVVAGEENILPNIRTEVTEGTLHIQVVGVLRPTREIVVDATSMHGDATEYDPSPTIFQGAACGISHSHIFGSGL